MHNKIRNYINKLLHDSSIAELRLQNTKGAHTHLTYNDVLYLNIIYAHSGKYTASNIADMLFVSRPAVTQKINELEKEGYIYKVQCEHDKRVYKLHTHRDGVSKKYYEVVDATDREIVESLIDKFTPAELNTFCKVTDSISELLLNETKRGE